MLQWKAAHGVTNKGFEEILGLVKNMLLPSTTYEANKIVCPLGLEVQKVHACPNDYILYCDEYEKLDACLVYDTKWYKIRQNNPGDVDGEPVKKKVHTKVMWYFPIISCLKHLFINKDHAKLMRWHKEKCKQDQILRHPADGSLWRNVDREFPDFDMDPRK